MTLQGHTASRLGLRARCLGSTSRAPSVPPQWPLISDPTSPRENERSGLRPDQRSKVTETEGASTSVPEVLSPRGIESPEMLASRATKARFELSMIGKFRSHIQHAVESLEYIYTCLLLVTL